MTRARDQVTADAFATSWNNLPLGSVYTPDQFKDWFLPLEQKDIEGKTVLELGCGNGSLLTHIASWEPKTIVGVDLGDSVQSCQVNMKATGHLDFNIVNQDLTEFESAGFDIVYSIGVLHHLKSPHKGFSAIIDNTVGGGKFHCWVYAKEGNTIIIMLVDPLRRLSSKLPWWITKYLIATPLTVPFYLYAKMLSKTPVTSKAARYLPLFHYMHWIKDQSFSFFRHVAFDQLVSPQTAYIEKDTIESWLSSHPNIEAGSTYIKFRNGNSWKFGGRKSV